MEVMCGSYRSSRRLISHYYFVFFPFFLFTIFFLSFFLSFLE